MPNAESGDPCFVCRPLRKGRCAKLAAAGRFTLADLGEQPLITCHEGFAGRSRLDRAFANTTRIAVRRGHYLRGFAYRFIELCAADLSESVVRAALAPGKDELNLD